VSRWVTALVSYRAEALEPFGVPKAMLGHDATLAVATSVSCGSASSCTAGGSYYINPGPVGSPGVAFAVGEKNGVWGSAHTFAGQDSGPPAQVADPPLILVPGAPQGRGFASWATPPTGAACGWPARQKRFLPVAGVCRFQAPALP
jgi:hypothetical protein